MNIHTCTASLETICLCRLIRDFRTTSNDAVELEVLDCICVCVRMCACEAMVHNSAQSIFMARGSAGVYQNGWSPCGHKDLQLQQNTRGTQMYFWQAKCTAMNGHMNTYTHINTNTNTGVPLDMSPWRLESKSAQI